MAKQTKMKFKILALSANDKAIEWAMKLKSQQGLTEAMCQYGVSINFNNDENMKIGILGLGEVGQAIKEVYLNCGQDHDIKVNDLKAGINEFEEAMQILNVCIPYSEKFEEVVEAICRKYNPGVTVIHSTVPAGTTKRLNDKVGRVVHSPVRGVHPKLYEGVKTFIKYIGADDQEIGEFVKNHFVDDLKLPVVLFDQSKATELAKLLDTTYYGLCIAYHKYADDICREAGVKFTDVMTDFNESYNLGYKVLGKHNVVRPVLYAPEDGKIGGHCVIPNAELLREQFGDDPVLQSILRLK